MFDARPRRRPGPVPGSGSAILLLLTLVLGAGCAAKPATQDSSWPRDRAEISGIPLFPQEAYQCGPAALATVLVHFGDVVTPEEIAGEVFSSHRRGSLSLDLVLYARTRGFSAQWFKGEIADLTESVLAGEPLIVMVDNGVLGVSTFHFLVLTGYGPEGVVVHDGGPEKSVIPWSRFIRSWERTDSWTLRIRPEAHSHRSMGPS
ncbi:MAG: C39 family peptidase [Desulfovibrionales bacterium]